MSAIDGLILGIFFAGFGFAVYRRREIRFGEAIVSSLFIGFATIGLLLVPHYPYLGLGRKGLGRERDGKCVQPPYVL